MRPDDFIEQPGVRLSKVSCLSPEVDEMLDIRHGKRSDEVNGGLPEHVVAERLVRKAIHQREVVRDEDHLGYHQRHDGGGQKIGNTNAKLLQHQRLSEREQLKRDEEK